MSKIIGGWTNMDEYSKEEEAWRELEAFRSRPGETDNVNHPAHYAKGDVECIDALEAATINLQGRDAVCTANAIKYLWRWKQKGGVEDLKKARWYINRLIGE